jgi:glutathione S-transferase
VNAWLRRVEQTPGFVTMDWTPDTVASDHVDFAAEA